MSALQESLRHVLAVDGVRTAALIDVATGMIVRSVGKPDPDLATTAACVAPAACVTATEIPASRTAGTA